MKFCTLMGKKHKQKLIGSHGTHMHCRTSLIRLGPTLYTDVNLGLNQHKPPILIRGSYSNFPVNANSISVYSLFIVIFCVHVSVNIFRSRRQKSGFLTLGVQKGQNTFVFGVGENVGHVGVLYRIWEKSVIKTCSCDISRRGATSKNFHTPNLINHLKTDLRQNKISN